MLPQVGAGGGTPKPRNDSALSDSSTQPNMLVDSTATGAMQLGSTWRNIETNSALPIMREASTYSRSRIDSTVPRTTRTTDGAYARPSASTMPHLLAPTTTMIPSASRMPGNANSA